MKFCVGDRVFANGKKTQGKYENTVNEIGVVKRVFKSGHNCYGVLFDNLTNIASEHGLYWFSEGEISDIKDMRKSNNEKDTSSTETSINYIPTIQEIIDKKLTCVIHTATKEQAKKLLGRLTTDENWYREALTLWDSYKEDTCYSIKNGIYNAYQGKRYYEADPDVFTIYEFEDVFRDINSNSTQSIIPTIEEIRNLKLNCAVHIPHKGDVDIFFKYFSMDIETAKIDIQKWKNHWDFHTDNTYYFIENGIVTRFGNKPDKSYYSYKVYEFEDLLHSKGDTTNMNTNNNIPTMEEIINNKIDCIIHTPTKELAKVLFDNIKPDTKEVDFWISCWEHWYRTETCYYIRSGNVISYGDYHFYVTSKDFKSIPVYEIEGIIKVSKINNKYKSNKSNNIKEEKKMNKTFEVIKGTRPNTNKGETGYVDTITTIANTPCGRSTVTCDAFDYDVYTGALVASAKIAAKSNNNAAMMYNMAIELWGTDTSKSILHTLANVAFKGYFDSNYKRWQKSVAYQERLKEKATRTCPICGEVFKTIEEKEKHIKWHEECKARREAKKLERKERREAQRRIAEMQSEGRIEQYMKELATKEDNSTTDNAE